MTGTYEHSIDAKGRLFIPAKLREELGVTFYLAMGIDTCLAIYPQSHLGQVYRKICLPAHDTVQGHASPVCQRGEVRAGQPGTHRHSPEAAQVRQLEKDAVILGVNDRAEIWSAQL